MYDPTHRAHLPAETITATQLACYSASVVTALSVQDSNSVLEVAPIQTDIIDAQARVILEDMTIRAFKVGTVFEIDTLDTIANIASDYPDTPLVITFGKHFYNHVEISSSGGVNLYSETLTDAYLDILAPLSKVAVIDAHYAQQWTSEDFDIHNIQDLFAHILDLGAEYCLILNEKHGNAIHHRLIDTNDHEETFIHNPDIQTPAEFADMVATGVACFLANGKEPIEAVELSIRLVLEQIEHQVQLGMGKPQIDRLATYEA